MREISPRAEPVTFTQSRAGSLNDINYGYALIPSELRAELKDALITEQRRSMRVHGHWHKYEPLAHRALVAPSAL